MKCVKCGAKLRRQDRFCPSCGCPVSPDAPGREYPGASVGEKKGRNRRGRNSAGEPDPLYDEHLYRDTFLEERGEERSQAFLMTMLILLIVLLMAGGFLLYYYVLREKPEAGYPVTSADNITIIQDGNQMLPGEAETESMLREEETDTEETAEPGQTEAAETKPSAESEAESGTAGNTKTGKSAETETDPGAQALPETEEPQTEQKDSLAGVPEGIAQIMETYSDADRYGVYVYDLKTGASCIAGEGEEPMYASAVISVPILYTAAVLLDEGKISQEDPIVYVNSVGGRGEAFPEEKDGKTYPLSYYLKAMLAYSDNNCMNCLVDFLGLDVINETCRSAGYQSVDLQRKIVAEVTDNTENYISAADLGGMVYELYTGTFRQIGTDYMKENFRIEPTEEGSTIIGLAAPVQSMDGFLNQDGLGDTRFAEVAAVVNGEGGFVLSEMMMGKDGFSYIDAGIEIAAYVCGVLTDQTEDNE